MKNRMLESGLFIDNMYLDKYIEICTTPINDNSLCQETHHIFPRAASKILNEEIDNSIENLVTLDIKNHVLAHYYLALCTKNKKLRFVNELCIQLITHRNFNEISEQWILDNLTEINAIRLEQRKLNSELQIGLQSGDKNPNCRYKLDVLNLVKQDLIAGLTKKIISEQHNVPVYIISAICKGTHWSCKVDHFNFNYRKEHEVVLKPAPKIKQPSKQQIKIAKIAEWSKEAHYCKNCGCLLTEYISSKNGDGCFCSKHCSMSWTAKERFRLNPELRKSCFAYDHSGSNNPNFGKHASAETREKISIARKNSPGVQNSPRFSGHKHTEESKRKTSESLKRRYKNKSKQTASSSRI